MTSIDSVDSSLLLCRKDFPNENAPIRALPPAWFLNREMFVVIWEVFSGQHTGFNCMSLDATSIWCMSASKSRCLWAFTVLVEDSLVNGYGGVYYGKTPEHIQLEEISQIIQRDYPDSGNIKVTKIKLFKEDSRYYSRAITMNDFP